MNNLKYFSKRIILMDEAIDDKNASIIVKQLIDLHDISNSEDIYILIDSPGGLVSSSYAIFDTIKWCKCDINTICLNLSSSISTLILSAGTKGKRYAFSEAMISPTLHTSAKLDAIYSSNAEVANRITEKTIEIFANLTDNDYVTMKSACLTEHFLTASDAKSKGFIDNVIFDKCFGNKMVQATHKYRFLKSLDEIWYSNIIKKLELTKIIK